MAKIEDAEKLAADRKATIRYLKDMAETLEEQMAKNFAGGYFTLASRDALALSDVMEVLAQIDVRN